MGLDTGHVARETDKKKSKVRPALNVYFYRTTVKSKYRKSKYRKSESSQIEQHLHVLTLLKIYKTSPL